jgi:4-amino-4-deoxy-L-arabinose transferase-like glycosyltransferase
LVTTDVPLATFTTMALYFFWKKNALGLGLAVGGAMSSKFSGAVLPLVVITLAVWEIWRAEERKEHTRTELKSLILAGVVALLVIEATYLFLVPPWTYVENMRLVNANHNPNRLSYLLGDFSRTGWWYYFLLAFAIKATIPTLVTISAAAAQAASSGFMNRRGEIILLTGIAAYVIAVTAGAAQIGVRYLLPVFPLLFVWGSRIAVDLRRKAAGIVVLTGLLGWQIYAAITAFPNYIPYFNEMVGGPAQGIHYLDDSNIDWGQSMKQVATYIREQKLQHVEVLPFSPFDNPYYYGGPAPKRNDIDTYRMLISGNVQPGNYIISGHHLIRMMYIRPEWHPSRAIDRIGNALWVYRF